MRTRIISLAAAVLAVVGAGPVSADPPRNGRPAQGADHQVTLITGDRITFAGGDPDRASFTPGPGRDGIVFSTRRTEDHFYVVPSDVQEQVAAGRLDRRLFDVAGLIKAGYDDGSSAAIPVVVTYSGQAKSRPAGRGAVVTRQLGSVNGAAMKVDKATAGTFLTPLTEARSGVRKIWLDGKRSLDLDRSVPQIGAPAAWRAGHTGRGVAVAVLDTGVDSSHPDLADRVAGRKNFTEGPADDLVGHGTHVASTIVGTAAASAGRYRGVAPDATVYDGKVCADRECQESAILGGMEWAATEVKAKIVNLSLGGVDGPEVDPLEEAVNRLTAQTGALFVIAAGNAGPGEGTVGSPGSADAALTVGAVDEQDRLASFSSRGPRVGDGAVKPDITAPGVGIVAAKAAQATIGEPVGERYLRASGTSMAAPHVSGAAALLAQQHPGWTAADLKGALMASAKPAAELTSFQQGAGRVDVARGIEQSVVTEPGSLSFGLASWPHHDDTPVTKVLTYRNHGDQPVTLRLTVTLAGPTGEPAPASALALGASTVTVPAAGTASVRVTSNTNHSGPDGGYSGRITATDGKNTVVSVIGLTKEEESYDLTMNHVGREGQPVAASGWITGVDVEKRIQTYGTTATLRLPKGEYTIDSLQIVEQPGGEGTDYYSLIQPKVSLTKDTTAVLDARTAKEVTVTMPNPEAAMMVTEVGYYRASAAGWLAVNASLGWAGPTRVFTAQTGPSLPPDQLTGRVTSQWAREDANHSIDNSPYLYAQLQTMLGFYPTGFRRDVKEDELAVVEQRIHATVDQQLLRFVQGDAPYLRGGTWSVGVSYDTPATTKVLVTGQQVNWQTVMAKWGPDPEQPPLFELGSLPRSYEPGRTYQERYNAAAFTPSPLFANRTGDRMALRIDPLSDADGNKGNGVADSQSSKLTRDGQVIAESETFGRVEVAGLPAGRATYTLESTQTRRSSSTFSTRTDLKWTFGSDASTPKLPMVGVRYQPAVDERNVADRTPMTVLPVVVDTVPGEALPRISKLVVQASGDDGKTWRTATVTSSGAGRYKAVFGTPPNARTVSLKVHLVDAEGNVTDQTVIGAYPLR